MSSPQFIHDRLRQAEVSGGLRTLTDRRGIDFCSNDYLDFSSDPDLKRRFLERVVDLPLGSTGSRLLRGQMDVFEQTERQLAEFSKQEAAILFASGYQANLGLFSSLLRPGDLVYSDEKNHASIIDGIRLGRGETRVYPHNQVAALRELLEADRNRVGLKIIVTESLFSMDGDQAPLLELASLAEEFSAQLIVDEAHATGLWGSGLVESCGLKQQVFATIHTGGKALGCAGAWIACDAALKKYLINFGRALIFSTAPIPSLAAALGEAIGYWSEVGQKRANLLHKKSEFFKNLLSSELTSFNGCGPIFPIVLGSNARALNVAQSLMELGFDVRAIRPPTVPEGSSRLRMTIRSQTEIEDMNRLSQIFKDLMKDSL